MTTKTKTMTAAEQSHQRLAEARETLQERSIALEGMREDIEAVNRTWKAGDDSIPASRLTDLQAEEIRLSSLVAAAERNLQLAERGLRTDKPELAEAVALALGTSIHGIEAEAVSETPKIDSDIETPRLFVIQAKAHNDVGDGTVSGQCVIKLFGPSWMEKLDPTAIHRTLHGAGMRFRKELRLNGDQINVEAEYATPKVPTIRSMPEDKGASVTVDVRHIIERNAFDSRLGEPMVKVSDSIGEVVSVHVDEDGVRTAVIDVAATLVNNPRSYWDADTAVEQTKSILASLMGSRLSMLGRVSNVQHISVAMAEDAISGGRGRRMTTRFTTVSKVRAV